MVRKIFALLLVFSCVIKAYSQKEWTRSSLDSLIKVVEQNKDEKRKLRGLLKILEILEHGGRPDTSLYYLRQATTIALNLNNQQQLANIYTCFGNTYLDMGDYPRALNRYMQSLKIGQELKSTYYIANATCNIGLVYYSTNDYDKALEYYQKALQMDISEHDSANITAAECDIGEVYSAQKKYPEALQYFRMCLAIDNRRKYLSGIAPDLDDIGNACAGQQQYDSAVFYYLKAIEVAKKINDVISLAQFENDLGDAYLKMKKYDDAAKVLILGSKMADTIGSLEDKKKNNFLLSQLYTVKGDWQKAFQYFQKYTVSKDSLANEANGKEIGRLEAKAGYDKELALQQAEQDKKEEIANAESRHQKIVIGFITAIALAISIIAIIVFRSLKITRKQKQIIEVQKEEVERKNMLIEEKNKDILDSIRYAKRIQRALFKEEEYVTRRLPEHFIYFKPRDIVSGDFYWGYERENHWYVAAIDCTGHGVPGAFLTMLGSAFLNEICGTGKILTPAEVLNQLRDKVVKELGAHGEVKDGMDISMCRINTQSREVQWSGANNPLWYVDNGAMKEITADKQPIGVSDNPKPFTNHILTGSCSMLYLFTDGYADQFGGPKGKKYKYRQLQEKLQAISTKPVGEQKRVLEKEFYAWKGNLEQTDDVCIIGIRV